MLPLATPRTWGVGEVVTAALMNAEIRDQMNALRNAEEIVIKPSLESVTSSTTMQNDNHLLASLAANALYKLTAYLAVTGSATGDFKCAWTLPSGATAPARFCRGPSVSTTGSTADSTLNAAVHGREQSRRTDQLRRVQHVGPHVRRRDPLHRHRGDRRYRAADVGTERLERHRHHR
ncbi:hypothetical protein ACIOWI_29830 [Streptomyces sp. NPDC087659]|uniref:hypothetical protein n=1 Tax=Streptomyces sp. NPDC087659 TaxID=3365801 RepID=UPI003826E443